MRFIVTGEKMDLNQLASLAGDSKIRNLVMSLVGGGGNKGDGAAKLTGGAGAEAGANPAAGGIGDLLGKLGGSNLQQQVSSWIGPGDNQPVTADQVQNALGTETITHAAQDAGMSPDEAAEGLAKVLPQIVDKATPDGMNSQDVPSSLADKFGSMMSGLQGQSSTQEKPPTSV